MKFRWTDVLLLILRNIHKHCVRFAESTLPVHHIRQPVKIQGAVCNFIAVVTHPLPAGGPCKAKVKLKELLYDIPDKNGIEFNNVLERYSYVFKIQ